MVRNEQKYEQAKEYRKRGFTYAEIAKICGVSKSTVSAWLSKESFSKVVVEQNVARAARDNKKRISLLNKARANERSARYREAVRSAETEHKHYKKDQLFTAGLMIYLSQGDLSRETTIRLSTYREDSQRIFIRFAREYLGTERSKFRCWLMLHRDHNESKCLKRWAKCVEMSVADFRKSQRVGATHSRRPLHFGTLNTIIGSTVLKKKLLRWIELSSKELIK